MALGKASPQARRHFTRFDQVEQLVRASEADPDLGFMGRLMALCSLPRTDPGHRLQYKRINGPYTLVMSASGLHKLPFGNLPRLLIVWLCTEAVRTQSRELVLGSSLSEFMRKLGMAPVSGGTTGGRTRLRNQMKRLFNASVRLVYKDERGEQFIASHIADRGEVRWDPRRTAEPSRWESKIRLGESFFNEIINHPVPLDMNTLKALKRSSLGLDLYLWLTYRIFTLKRPMCLSWQHLYRQFGVDPSKAEDHYTVKNFRHKVLRELIKIKTAWPGLNYATAPGVLVLLSSRPAISPARAPSVVADSSTENRNPGDFSKHKRDP